MSAICIHLDADAFAHPECSGCRAVSALIATERQLRGPRWNQLYPLVCERLAAMRDPDRPARDRINAAQSIVSHGIDEAMPCDLREAVVAFARGENSPTVARSLLDPSGENSPMVVRSLLDPSGDVVAEREAYNSEERPGVWADEDDADLRTLTQTQTDLLIRTELWTLHSPHLTPAEAEELRGIVGKRGEVLLATKVPRMFDRAHRQRGGIDSDPLVRVLAFRAWGDRDRRWFELRGLKAVTTDPLDRVRLLYGFDELWSYVDRERVLMFTADAHGRRARAATPDVTLRSVRDPTRFVIKALNQLAAALRIEAPPPLRAPEALFEELVGSGVLDRANVMRWFKRATAHG